jgi:hypothetical protein
MAVHGPGFGGLTARSLSTNLSGWRARYFAGVHGHMCRNQRGQRLPGKNHTFLSAPTELRTLTTVLRFCGLRASPICGCVVTNEIRFLPRTFGV